AHRHRATAGEGHVQRVGPRGACEDRPVVDDEGAVDLGHPRHLAPVVVGHPRPDDEHHRAEVDDRVQLARIDEAGLPGHRARSRRSAVTALPSAWPLVAFMTWPTKNPVSLPRTFSSPATSRSPCSGFVAIPPSTTDVSASAPMASKPLAWAIAAGSWPEATISASTVLACVAVSWPPVSMARSAARREGSSAAAPSTARLCSTWVRTHAGSPP